MTHSKRDKGIEMFGKCYGDAITAPEAGQDPFFDIMLENLFGSVWAREEVLSIRERRLFTMGIIAALGEYDVFGIQIGSALKTGELSPEQARELVIHAASYAGYPRSGGLRAAAEKAIAQWQKQQPAAE